MNSWNLLTLASAALLHIGVPPLPSVLLFPGEAVSGDEISGDGISDGEISGVVLDAVSGVPVEGAEVVLLQTRLGSRTSHRGAFRIVNRPGEAWSGEVEVRHPCFHTVRIEVGGEGLGDPLVVGLPFRVPRGPDGTATPVLCEAYGPKG